MKINSLNRLSLFLFIVLMYPSVMLAEEIPLMKRGGVYTLPIEVNGVITLNFILDTGASEVNIPAEVALTLYHAGTIRDTDFLPGQTYTLADGSTLNSSRFLLRSLKIGSHRLANVPASIGPVLSPLLLGQSFLERLGAWGIDSQKQVLTMGKKVVKEASVAQKPYIPEEKYRSIPAAEIDLEKIFIDGDKLSYAGYDVERSFNQKEQKSSFTIKKDGKVLVYLDSGCCWKDSTKIGLFSFLGNSTKQLVVEQYSGGASCCSTFMIYELTPSIRVIFDDKEYGYTLGRGGLIPIDFYGTGKYDFVRFVGTFRYFGDLCGACSPGANVVFSYENKTGKYVVSSKKFANYLLQDIGKYMGELQAITVKSENYSNFLAVILQVFLSYIYAGQEKQGWEFYNRTYAFTNKEKIRQEIIKKLNSDPVYRAIYIR